MSEKMNLLFTQRLTQKAEHREEVPNERVKRIVRDRCSRQAATQLVVPPNQRST